MEEKENVEATTTTTRKPTTTTTSTTTTSTTTTTQPHRPQYRLTMYTSRGTPRPFVSGEIIQRVSRDYRQVVNSLRTHKWLYFSEIRDNYDRLMRNDPYNDGFDDDELKSALSELMTFGLVEYR